MSSLYLLLLLLPLVAAQTFHWGPCNTPKVQPSFNLQQYLGRWYEIEKLPASFERGKCIEANYSLRKDGTIRVLNSQFDQGKRRTGEGTAVVRDLTEAAKLGVSFSYCENFSSSSLFLLPEESSVLRIKSDDSARLSESVEASHQFSLHASVLRLDEIQISLWM
ncbi:apolipoprotein Db isoform X2 [Hippoglossus hippoglossus]|uniref:apolipoprotein Db isoform X2 n=1 Tax=Hippoglossus hippoglossus TaxID=8267 RepID=UPI00148B92C0|nr:apolipoprotein Db isoform X2 [Hippoglossus hippoglossus]